MNTQDNLISLSLCLNLPNDLLNFIINNYLHLERMDCLNLQYSPPPPHFLFTDYTLTTDNPNEGRIFPSFSSFNDSIFPQFDAQLFTNYPQVMPSFVGNVKEIGLSSKSFPVNLINSIVQRAVDLGVCYKYEAENLTFWGQEFAVNLLSQFVDGLNIGVQEEENKKNGSNKEEEEVQKAFELSENMMIYFEEIKSCALNFQLKIEYKSGWILIAGKSIQILEFMEYLYTLALACHRSTLNETLEKKKNNESSYQEVSLSTCHRLERAKIWNKAVQLDLNIGQGYEIATIKGSQENIEKLKGYLYDMDQKMKRSLYPKYWDIYETNIYTEIQVAENSEEFDDVNRLFSRSMPQAFVTKLTRIQNKYLMDHYLTTLQKRQELYVEVNLNRKYLFHGTGSVNPQVIYRDSDTGFDLQYAKIEGLYGSGLYFANDASYSHKGYAHKVDMNKFQLLLADVFIGNPYVSPTKKSLVKAPNGFDSVQSADLFYVVYNNFHSYPLYLIEYSLK